MLITEKTALDRFISPNRIWQGIASIERTEKGRLFATFYSGNCKETLGNYALLLSSDDEGETWTDPTACAYAGEGARCFDPNLWIDPLGRLWWWWSVIPVNSVWAVVCDDPDAETLIWSEPRCIGGEVMMNKPIVTSAGDWLFPMSVWDAKMRMLGAPATFTDHTGPYLWRSRDHGAAFHRIGCPEVKERSFDEHMVIELKDGRLMMLVRTHYGIAKSYSSDGGETWTDGVDSGIPGPNSRFCIRRLSSGRILLVNHLGAGRGTRSEWPVRTNLCAWLSDDECESWKGPLMLDDRLEVSYPDMTERSGYLWIAYDRERGGFKSSLAEAEACAREILFCKITEEDILAGKLVNPGSFLRKTVNKLGKFEGDATAFYE